MKNITFVFNEGRKLRLDIEPNGPKEFFYTYSQFKEINPNVNFIEMKPKGNFLLDYIFKGIRKVLDLPIYTEKLLTFKNINTIFKSEIVVATNQNIGYSLLPILIIKKIFIKSEFYIISMGILENLNNKKINNLIVKKLIKFSTKIIFISKNELKIATDLFPKYNFKFLYIPFGIDTKFWKAMKNRKKINNKILFIGNDNFRDFNFIVQLAQNMKQFQFTFLTNRIEKVSSENITLINGSWKDHIYSDNQVRKLYQNHSITLIPLVESLQPSGQSVALQSISSNTPVIISKIKGFWDYESFEDNKHIIFMSENNIDIWKSKIEELLSNEEKYRKIVTDGNKLVKENFNIEIMFNSFRELFNF